MHVQVQLLVHGTEHINGGPHSLIMDGSVYSKEQTDTTLAKKAVELTKILNKTITVLEKLKICLCENYAPKRGFNTIWGIKS